MSDSTSQQNRGLRLYDLLASAFLQEKVDTCFALLGDANMYWASRLAERGCRMVHVRHEHCAVAAAMAWARMTGRVGVASVTCGPGLTQTMTALPAAVLARIPLVVFAGEPPLKAAWYNQMIEQAPFVQATGAAYQRLHAPSAWRRPCAMPSSRPWRNVARWFSACRWTFRTARWRRSLSCPRLHGRCWPVARPSDRIPTISPKRREDLQRRGGWSSLAVWAQRLRQR